MTLFDLFFNGALIYVLGLLVGLIPSHTFAYLKIGIGFYLLKTLIWMGLRIPLMLPIDRWLERGSPPDDNDPALIRAIYYFPFDFTIFYGWLLGMQYACMMLWLVYEPGPLNLGQELVFPGLLFAGAVMAGAVAVGVPLNLIMTSKFSRRLAERPMNRLSEMPGRKLSLRVKMVTISLALGCAPSLLLFGVQTFVQIDGLYQEAERSATAVTDRMVHEVESYARWALSEDTFPFSYAKGQNKLNFWGLKAPPEGTEEAVRSALETRTELVRERQMRLVIRHRANVRGDAVGVVVRLPQPRNNWLALSLVLLLASVWPFVTAILMEKTIVGPVSTISDLFHRITGRGKTEETDTVPIFYKDEVGRLAFNANRTLDTLTEARRQVEQNARKLGEKNRELEEAYRTKGEFLANMSHELRTPLNAIIGFSRLMKRKLKDLPPRQAKNLDLIKQSGEQLLILVNDLLDFEKIEAGKLTVKREAVDFATLWESLQTTLTPVAQEKELGLKFTSEDAPVSIHTDKERLRQILTNLITNAIKYSDEGEISVVARTVESHLEVCVKDQGIGMSPEQVEKIFDPFHQVDSSRTRERGGVGLGLAIVGRLVRILRGTIDVSSTPGEGSTFVVKLPLVDDISHLVPRGAGAEVLVVDDNLDYLEAIHTELSEAGYRVQAANSGPTALEFLEGEYRPSVILLDIVMPEMDGWEVLKRIRENPELETTPVVITSVVDDKPVGLDLDVSGWLTKPFEFEELKQFLVNEHRDEGGLEGGLVIVEDDPQTAALLEQGFEDSGLQPKIFSTEKEARALLEQETPAVLILDLHLEEGSGWSILSYFRSLPENERTRVFIYTASDLSQEEKESLRESFVTVVTKHGQDSLTELVNTITG